MVMSAKKSIYTFLTLCISFWVCGMLVACLDIPSKPSSSGKVTSLKVYNVQNGIKDSTDFHINAKDTAIFIAQVFPDKYEDRLEYTWFHDNDELHYGKTFKDFFELEEDTPNRVVVTDRQGNSIEKTFHFILNTPPSLSSRIYPANNSEFLVDETQVIEFQWFVEDSDNDMVTSILTIDNQVYDLGNLTSIAQSGFSPGPHTFSIEIFDPYGGNAKSSVYHFNVINPEE